MPAIGDVTVTTISSDTPAVLANQLVRLAELETLLNEAEAGAHTHYPGDIIGILDYIGSGVQSLVSASNSVSWFGLTPSVIVNPNGAIEITAEGLSVVLGSSGTQAAAGNHTHTQLHDALTVISTDDVSLTLNSQELSASVNLVDGGGIKSTGSGLQADTTILSAAGHTHSDLHKPVEGTTSDSIELTITNGPLSQQIYADLRINQSPGEGHAVLEITGDGVSIPLGTSGVQAAAGNHTHPEATTSAAGLLSAADKRRLVNYEQILQVEQIVSFFKADALLKDQYIGGPIAFTTQMEIIGVSASYNCGDHTEPVYIGIEVNGALVYSDLPIIALPDNERWTMQVPSFYDRTTGSSLGVFVAAGDMVNVLCHSGVQTLPETAPYNMQVYLNFRSSYTTLPTLELNCGGAAVTPFIEDASFTGGSAESTTETIDISEVSDPAPEAIYQSQRRVESSSYPGKIVYTITGLAAYYDYNVRLHFCEYQDDVLHQSYFQVKVYGAITDPAAFTVDIESDASGTFKAYIVDYPARSSVGGTITIELNPVPNESLYYCASICAIEILSP